MTKINKIGYTQSGHLGFLDFEWDFLVCERISGYEFIQNTHKPLYTYTSCFLPEVNDSNRYS